MALFILMAVAWCLAYLLIIIKGFKDKRCGMPMQALVFNFSWELMLSFIYPMSGVARYVVLAWLFLDVFILLQYLIYEKPKNPSTLQDKLFYPAFIIMFLMALGTVIAMTNEFQDWSGGYSGLGMNLIMSISFNSMLLTKNNLKGQSIYIAISKLIGTAATFATIHDSILLWFWAIAVVFFDAVYVVLVFIKSRELKLNPWKF